MTTWNCSQCLRKICNTRLWCPRCQERLDIDDRKFSDCYACKIWIHPEHYYPEICEIMGPLDENLTWDYPIDEEYYLPEHVIWWYAKITKWGEIIEGKGEIEMAYWFNELDNVNAVESYYSDLQIFRGNTNKQP